MMFSHCFLSHGVLKRNKLWTGEGLLTLELLQPSNVVLVPSKRSKAHSTVSTQCLITTLCVRWDSKNGSDAIILTEMTEELTTIEALKVAWLTWKTRIITHVSENGMRLLMPALITSWDFWWSFRMPKRPKIFGQETSATAKSECSQQSLTRQVPLKELHTLIDLFRIIRTDLVSILIRKKSEILLDDEAIISISSKYEWIELIDKKKVRKNKIPY